MVAMVIETDEIKEVEDVGGLKDRNSRVGKCIAGWGDIHQLLASEIEILIRRREDDRKGRRRRPRHLLWGNSELYTQKCFDIS